MGMPDEPKLYHIIHFDRLPSVISDGFLWSDAEVRRSSSPGTTIGMPHIKLRRLTELKLTSFPDLHVGDCVPFYFCPRSVMLFLIFTGNDNELTYCGGQGPIVHLESDLRETDVWAKNKSLRCAFTLSNAGSYWFDDLWDLTKLNLIDWDAVQAKYWKNCRDSKQAEFLVEKQFPWELVKRIGVHSEQVYKKVMQALESAEHRPHVEIKPNWYY